MFGFNRLLARLLRRPQFITIKDENGNVTVMDPMTAEYLASNNPNPSQQALDQMLSSATRVRVFDGGMSDSRPLGANLLDVADPESLAALRDDLAIVEDPTTFGHCMCLGDLAMQFYAHNKLVATIGLHHGRSIRSNVWKHDAQLQNGKQLLTWLADRGVTAPLEAYEADQRRAQAYHEQADRWQAAVPSCLEPYTDQIMGSFPSSAPSELQPLLEALRRTYPEPQILALELFSWFGSGAGPWTGFPSYETLPESLLLTFPASLLVEALGAQPLQGAHVEGAARYFAGWTFNHHKGEEAREIPLELKRRLLEHSLRSSDADKRQRAEAAFGR